ncbi:MAG: hypothetical protein AAGF11_05890 [Myxococcota bacterium]
MNAKPPRGHRMLAPPDSGSSSGLGRPNKPKLAEIASREEGRKQGQREGLRQAIELVCNQLGIMITEPRRIWIKSLDVAALQSLIRRLLADRRWP